MNAIAVCQQVMPEKLQFFSGLCVCVCECLGVYNQARTVPQTPNYQQNLQPASICSCLAGGTSVPDFSAPFSSVEFQTFFLPLSLNSDSYSRTNYPNPFPTFCFLAVPLGQGCCSIHLVRNSHSLWCLPNVISSMLRTHLGSGKTLGRGCLIEYWLGKTDDLLRLAGSYGSAFGICRKTMLLLTCPHFSGEFFSLTPPKAF